MEKEEDDGDDVIYRVKLLTSLVHNKMQALRQRKLAISEGYFTDCTAGF